ncbi:hypothetical protein ACRAWF_33590 [Streptomyces sp. L7]
MHSKGAIHDASCSRRIADLRPFHSGAGDRPPIWYGAVTTSR